MLEFIYQCLRTCVCVVPRGVQNILQFSLIRMRRGRSDISENQIFQLHKKSLVEFKTHYLTKLLEKLWIRADVWWLLRVEVRKLYLLRHIFSPWQLHGVLGVLSSQESSLNPLPLSFIAQTLNLVIWRQQLAFLADTDYCISSHLPGVSSHWPNVFYSCSSAPLAVDVRPLTNGHSPI